MTDSIMVSICCITYNHEKYISRAIESFLAQKVSFKFEVLIHDDASEDGTAKIIKSYQEKYPDIIKAICNTENQYSKGIAINPTFNFSRAKGKYIALCEGDDYFVDENKLEKQVDYMENHPNCHICFHNALIVDTNENVIGTFLPRNELLGKYYKNRDCSYTSEEMIMLDFVPTNSLLFKLEDILKLPDFYFDNISCCGDLSIRLFLASLGSGFGFSGCYSAYRSGTENSASQRASRNYEILLKTLNGHIKILNEFKKYANGEFDQAVNACIDYKLFYFFYRVGATFTLKSNRFINLYKQLSLKTRIKYFLRTSFIGLYHCFYNKSKHI